jgi:hypothetical protein
MKNIIIAFLIMLAVNCEAQKVYYIASTNSNGIGTKVSPFNTFENAIKVLNPGDTLLVAPGIYNITKRIETFTNGRKNARITIKAQNFKNLPVIKRAGMVILIKHEWQTIDGLIIDACLGEEQAVCFEPTSNNLIFSNCEVRNGLRNGISIHGGRDIQILNCHIHHFLRGTWDKYKDAHGIGASHQRNLLIKGCNIHQVSGDCIQSDPSMEAPLWDSITIVDCKLWTGPLTEDFGGFKKGQTPGENGFDTKTDPTQPFDTYRPYVKLENVEAFGFIKDGYINNRAAFNIKHNVRCDMNRIKVYNCDVAFRLRGPNEFRGTFYGGALVTMTNVIAYQNEIIFKLESKLEKLDAFYCTFDAGPKKYIHNTEKNGFVSGALNFKNCLFLLLQPAEVSHISNRVVVPNDFLDYTSGKYQLKPNSWLKDKAIIIDGVDNDYYNKKRIKGKSTPGAVE